MKNSQRFTVDTQDFAGKFSYLLYNNSNLLPGIGDQYEAGGMLIYKPMDRMSLYLGASGIKYNMNGGIYNDFLFNAGMTYVFNDWLRLYLYAQYSLNATKNSYAGAYYLSPQNSYGAVLMIKIADKKKYSVDMNIGAERTYNPFNKEWEMNYRLGPEIRLK